MAVAAGEDGPRRRAKFPPKRVPTATAEDMQEFVGMLADMRNGNETEVPGLLASKVEFLLSRDVAQLMRQLDAQCRNDDERAELTELFDTVIDFVEQFVANTAMLSAANGQLLREILEAAAMGMQALDLKMQQMLSGNEPRYTPEFIRYLDAEILRLRGVVAGESEAATRTDADPDRAPRKVRRPPLRALSSEPTLRWQSLDARVTDDHEYVMGSLCRVALHLARAKLSTSTCRRGGG